MNSAGLKLLGLYFCCKIKEQEHMYTKVYTWVCFETLPPTYPVILSLRPGSTTSTLTLQAFSSLYGCSPTVPTLSTPLPQFYTLCPQLIFQPHTPNFPPWPASGAQNSTQFTKCYFRDFHLGFFSLCPAFPRPPSGPITNVISATFTPALSAFPRPFHGLITLSKAR